MTAETRIFDKCKDALMTTKEAAAYLKISCRTLLNMCSNGTVRYQKVGRRNRFQQCDLDALIKPTRVK